jgi:hypothetical protein
MGMGGPISLKWADRSSWQAGGTFPVDRRPAARPAPRLLGPPGWREFFLRSGRSNEDSTSIENRPRMAIPIVVDNSGDSRFEFDPSDRAAVAEAAARFTELTALSTRRPNGPRLGGRAR